MITEYEMIDTLPKKSFVNIKVLLAEDNEVNQLLARRILDFWGLEVKVAVTGYEVVDLLKKEDFDLVLMDIQMPDKSGIEATNEIRNFKDKRKKNIPIIALTANALKGEEKKYIAAGMDDFLTKPFKEADLHEIIERVMRKEGSFGRESFKEEANQNKQMEAVLEIEEKLFDFTQMEEIAAGNGDFLVALAQIYLDTIPVTSTEMLEATRKGEWDKASKLAHKLKSTIDSLNIDTIQSEIRSIEVDGKNRVNAETLKKHAVKVNVVIHQVAQQLKEQFSL